MTIYPAKKTGEAPAQTDASPPMNILVLNILGLFLEQKLCERVQIESPVSPYMAAI